MATNHDNTCSICYENRADIIVCWNEHKLCQECYTTSMESARSQLKNCAMCRIPMFYWNPPRQVSLSRRRQLIRDYGLSD